MTLSIYPSKNERESEGEHILMVSHGAAIANIILSGNIIIKSQEKQGFKTAQSSSMSLRLISSL